MSCGQINPPLSGIFRIVQLLVVGFFIVSIIRELLVFKIDVYVHIQLLSQ